MPLDPEVPRRRFRFLFDAHADTPADLARCLDDAYAHIATLDDGDPRTECTTGGVTSGWHLEITEDPEQTAERYQLQLQQYMIEIHARAAHR